VKFGKDWLSFKIVCLLPSYKERQVVFAQK